MVHIRPPHCNQQCFNICPTMASRNVSWHRWNFFQVFGARRWLLSVSLCCRLLARQVLKGSKEQETPGPHTVNWTCDWLQCYSWEAMDDCPYSPNLYAQALVPQLDNCLNVSGECSRVCCVPSATYTSKFLASECLLPYFLKPIVHIYRSEILCWSV